jgi:hypothetical protein
MAERTRLKSGTTPGGRSYYATRTPGGKKETVVGGSTKVGPSKYKFDSTDGYQTSYKKSTPKKGASSNKTRTTLSWIGDGWSSENNETKIKKGPTKKAKGRTIGPITAAINSSMKHPPKNVRFGPKKK